MTAPRDIRTHYETLFNLHPSDADIDCAAATVRLVRSWVKSKELAKGHDVDPLGKGWLFTGGEWKSKSSSVVVQSEVGNRGIGTAQFWALRYEEADQHERHRRWRTDVGVTRLEDGVVAIALRVSHHLMPAFIGEEPEYPLATSPKIVKSIINAKRWVSRAGSEVLRDVPIEMRLGNIPSLIKRMEDGARSVPLIVISARRDDGRYAIDPKNFAWGVAGAATVYVLSSAPDVIQEANYYIDYEYRCTNGLVRVYMPGVKLKSPNDFRRHRFFTADYVQQVGEAHVVDMLHRGLARRPIARLRDEVFDIDDINLRRSQQERQKLRLALQGAATREVTAEEKEWADFLLEENARLEATLKETSASRDGSEAKAYELETELETEIQAHDDRVRQLEYRVKEANDRAKRSEGELQNAIAAKQILESLQEFPRDLASALRLVERSFPSRVVVLEEAHYTAQSWPFDADKGWRVLRAMAMHLPELHFQMSGVDIEKEFERLSGFGLAMKEKKLTKEDQRATQQRIRKYRGREVDITPHVKVGSSKPNLLRVHYYADHDDKVIVIGHCGDHLDTAGTRKKA